MSTYATKDELATAGGSVVADDTPTAPAEGTSATYFVTAAVSWPAGLVWSTDPDGGVAPTITGTALVSLFTYGGTTRAVLGATFPALPDTVTPVAGTLAASSITETGFTITVTGASDDVGLHAQPYSFDTGAGAFGAWQTSASLAVTGKTAGTAYTVRHKVRDAAGNEATGASIVVATTAADTTSPTWTATFTMGTPTQTSVVATASAMAADNVAVTGYEVSYNNGSTYAAITPSGSNFTLSGSAGTTYATTKLRAKDAAGNYSTVLSVPSYTMASSTDTTNPTPGTLAASSITDTSFTLTVSGASDETALDAAPYSFSTDNGATWTAYQASASLAVTGMTAETAYTCQHRVKDAAGNASTGPSITVTTTEAPAGTTLFTDFSEYTTDAAPSDWSEPWNSAPTLTVAADAAATGGKVLKAVFSANARWYAAWDQVLNTTQDVEVVTRYRTTYAPNSSPIRVRAGGSAGAENDYYLSQGNVLRKHVNAADAVVGSTTSNAMNAVTNAWIWLRLRVNGTTIQSRTWADGSAEPSTWNTVTDTSLTAGTVGVGAYQGYNTYEWDVFGVGLDGATAPMSAS